MSIIDQNSGTVEQRIFDPPLHLQRYNVVFALSQHLLCRATSLLDVGSSTCQFGKFALSSLDQLDFSLLHHYHALDIYRDSLVTGALQLDEELRARAQMSKGCWVPKRASLYCGSVFGIGPPVRALCPSASAFFGAATPPLESSTADNNSLELSSRCSSSRCVSAPHAECIVSLDVVEHIPLQLSLASATAASTSSSSSLSESFPSNPSSSNSLVVDGPAAFLDWMFHTAPCPRCTRAVIVTTPNRADNVPVLKMQPDEMRHNDHKFEWDLEEFAAACRRSLSSSSSSSSSASSNHAEKYEESSASSFCAWLHFGVGGTASQGCVLLQRELLENVTDNDDDEKTDASSASPQFLLASCLAQLWRAEVTWRSAPACEETIVSEAKQRRDLLFEVAARVFAEKTVFGKLLGFELVPSRTSPVTLQQQHRRLLQSRHPVAGMELVEQLTFSRARPCGDQRNDDHELGSSDSLWSALYDIVLRAARKIKAAKMNRVADEKECEGEVAEEDDAVEMETAPTKLIWAASAPVFASEQRQEEDAEEEREQQEEVPAAAAAIRIPFSEIVSDSFLRQELSSIPVMALYFYFTGDEESISGESLSIPSSILWRHHPLFSDPASRRFAQHVHRVLTSGFQRLKNPATFCADDWWLPASLRMDLNQARLLSLGLDEAFADRQPFLEELLWAAVCGFFDGAVLEKGGVDVNGDHDVGERVVWM